MNSPRLPQELQDAVVGCLPHSDLHVASLVSKSWCRQGRKTLFREVRVLAPFTGGAFEQFMTGNPFYAGVVVTLALRGVDGPKQLDSGHDEDEDEDDGDDLDGHEQEPQLAISISLADISAILSLLPNLQNLELKDLSLVPSSIPLPIHLKAPTSLDELVLEHIVVAESVGAEDCLLNMWPLFSSVRSVKLVDIPNRLVSIAHEPDYIVNGSINLQATSCVIRDVRSCNVFLELLRRGCSASRPLTHLEVHTYATADFRSLGNLLQIAGGRLECLHLDISNSIRNVDSDYMEPYIKSRIVDRTLAPSLSACSALHTCTLATWMSVFEDEPSNENSWNCLTTLITQLPSTVRNLTIEVHGADDHVITQILDFDEVDRFAQSLRAWQHLDTLETFKLRFCAQRSEEPNRFYLFARSSYLMAPAFKALLWSATFDVEIMAMTWGWRSNGDGPPQPVEMPFDNQIPNISSDKLLHPYIAKGTDCHLGAIPPSSGLEVDSDGDADEGVQG